MKNTTERVCRSCGYPLPRCICRWMRAVGQKATRVTTVEQARALPEVSHPFLDERRRILEQDQLGFGRRGDTIVERVVRPFSPTPTDGDQILLFLDADGRSMQVVYTPDGPAKTPWRL